MRWEERFTEDHVRAAVAASRTYSEVLRRLGLRAAGGSTYHRGHLKRRLFAEGLKRPVCEICGQGPIWHGRRMSLVLDHANGVHDDNRLENLRILCPNCNATLDTHCGKHNNRKHPDRACPVCERRLRPQWGGQIYCSHACAGQG